MVPRILSIVIIHHARGDLAVGEMITIESILGTTFDVSVKESVNFGPYAAIVPKVRGRAFITGRHEFLVDSRDVIQDGFIFR